mgnify:CR=1 FL=1
MSNMSYCRFENTAADMRDCLEAMQDENFDFDELNEPEKVAIEEMECMIEDFQDMLINTLEGRE